MSLNAKQATRRPGDPLAPADEVPQRLLFAERKAGERNSTRKWNTNYGAVIRLGDEQFKQLMEKDRDWHGATGSADSGAASGAGGVEGPAQTRDVIITDDVPQAFSHFTLDFSQRATSKIRGPDGQNGRLLVCDVQGTYDKPSNTFMLYDPCVHSDMREKGLFGVTDRGAKGISEFLASHKCNHVCRMPSRKSSACCHCSPLSQALMAAL